MTKKEKFDIINSEKLKGGKALLALTQGKRTKHIMNSILKRTVALLLAGATLLPLLTACGKQELPPDTDDETKEEEGETVEPYYISLEKKELVSDFPFEYDETKFLKANETLKNNVNTDK